MPRLVMIRHGQSQWNLENRFTGWVDVDLSPKGVEEAHRAGRLLRELAFEPDIAHTSLLKRAIRTLWIALEEMDRVYVPQALNWRLNERHYGALQGLNKAETAERHGADQVHVWRRSYDTPPPPLDRNDPGHPRFDPRYKGLGDELPDSESLKDTLDRAWPYWLDKIAPGLRAGKDILIAAHGNSLRALCKKLLGIADDEITGMEIPTGNPLLLELGASLGVREAGYLDPETAAMIPGTTG